MTLNQLIPKFLKTLKGNTRTFYARPLELFAATRGECVLTAIRPWHVTEWVDGFVGASKTYRSNLVRAIKAPLRWAEQQGYIDATPLAKLPTPSAEARGDEAYLTPAEVGTVLAGEGDLQDILTLMRETGCRPKEARTAEARHIEGACIVFPKAEGKGGKQQRVIHLSAKAQALCDRLAVKYPTGPLFRQNGKPWSAIQLSAVTARHGKRLGVKVTPYSLRHTFATDAIINDVNLITVAALMGHNDVTMLHKVYQHVARRSDHLKDSLAKALGATDGTCHL